MSWYTVIAQYPEASFDASPFVKNCAGQYVLLDCQCPLRYARSMFSEASLHFGTVDLFRGSRIGRLLTSYRKPGFGPTIGPSEPERIALSQKLESQEI